MLYDFAGNLTEGTNGLDRHIFVWMQNKLYAIFTEQVAGNVEDKMNKTQNHGRKLIRTSTDEGYQCWRL